MAIDWKKLGQSTPTPTAAPPTFQPPPPPGGGVSEPKAKTPGMFEINVSPGGVVPAMEQNPVAGGDLIDQLNEQIFGQKGLGQLTNQWKFDNPVTDTIGNVGGFLGGAVKSGLGAAAAPFLAPISVPLGWLPNGADEHFRNYRDDAIKRNVWTDQDEQGWQTVDKDAASAGPGNGGNLKYNYLQDISKAQNEPDLFPLLSHGPAASLGGVLVQVFAGAFQAPQSIVERTIAGNEVGQAIFEKIGSQLLPGLIQPVGPPGDRIDDTLLRAQTEPDTLNEAETVVVAKLADGSWSRDQALDFMAGRMTGLSHDEITQIAGSVITDPTIIASLGSVAVAKVSAFGARIAETGFKALSPAEKFAVGLNTVAKGNVGRAAKVLRTGIDPLSAIGGNSSVAQGAVHLLAEEGTRAAARSYGQGAVNTVFRLASEMGFDLQPALRTYIGNGLRGFAAVKQRAALLDANKIESLLNTVPGGESDLVVGGRNASNEIVDYFDGIRKVVFTADEDVQLAGRMAEARFGATTPNEWRVAISKMSSNVKGMWHALSYGAADNELQIAKRDAIAAGSYTGRVDPAEVVLLNDHIVDNVVAGDLVKAVSAAKGTTKKAALIAEAIGKFPGFRMVGDVPGTKAGVERWIEYLGKQIDARAFHSRVLPGEVASMGPDMVRFVKDHPSWNLGFAPDDAVKWGFSYDVAGEVVLTHTPHVGHVSEAAAAFRPTADMARNVLGQVIGPKVGKLAGKLLDPIEIYSRTAAAQVSGMRVVRNMEQRFMQLGVGTHGMTESESRKMFTAIKDKAFDMKTTLQGMTPGPVWEVAKDVVPQRLRGKLGPREVFNLTMVASEGDLRVVGITSKLTSRIRSGLVTSGLTPGNMMGQISVSAYNLLRYSLNPIFITQRVSDMPFFQILRGVPLATPTIRDQTRRVLRNMVDTSLMRDFALENIEYRQHGDFASILTNKLAPGRNLAEKVSRFESRIIQAGQLDYIYANMGDLVKGALDDLARLDPGATLPETFAQLRARYSAQLGRPLGDSEVGLEYLKEQFWAGSHGPDSIGALVEDGARIMPGDIGELRPLDLNDIGRVLGHGNLAGLRRAMVASDQSPALIEWETIEGALQGWHYHPDQIERIKDGINFEWDTFFKDVAVKLELSPRESLRLQALISVTARERGMVPAEYLSQVMAHNVKRAGFKRGLEGLPEELRPTVELMRSAMIGTERERVSTLVNAVYTHLDPSAQRTLLEEFQVDIGARIQAAMDAGRTEESQFLNRVAEQLRGGWGPEANNEFADRILARMGGDAAAESNLPTHALSPDGFQRGRFVTPEEHQVILDRGQGLLHDLAAEKPGKVAWLDEAPTAPGRSLADLEVDAAPVKDSLVQKWRDSETKNRLRAEKDIDRLRNEGWDMGNAEDELGNYDGIDRGDFDGGADGREDYQDARQEAWDAMLDAMDESEFIGHEVGPAAAPTTADRLVDSAFEAVQKEWGGETFNARTGLRLEPSATELPDPAKGYLYHSDAVDTTKRGVIEGDWVDHLPTSKQYATTTQARTYRTNPDRLIGGVQKAPGWMGGSRAKVGHVEVSLDGGATWAPVQEGPFVTSIGKTESISFAEAADREAFGEAYQRFAAANADELRKPDRKIGVFRDEDAKTVSFDVNVTVNSRSDAESLQLAGERTGGAYDYSTGNNVFAAEVRAGSPDVERAVQYVSKWAKSVYLPEMVADRPAVGRGLANLVDNVPTGDAFAYNKTEAMALDLMRQNMNGVVMDSHRLADMSKSRSVFMRSLNHPLFGIYPASYMWGKVIPEFVRFMAKSPFGLRTGAMAYTMEDIQMSLAAQYELDPEFQKKVEEIGNSESAFFLSYMLPSFPWEDVAAGVAPGLRSFADKGLTSGVVTRQLDMMSPDRWISSAAGAAGELGDLFRGALPAAPASPPPPAPGPAGQLEGPLSESQGDLNEVLNRIFTGQP